MGDAARSPFGREPAAAGSAWSWVSGVIPWSSMAMTLRLTADESDALRQRAKREGRSMQDVAREAVREYIDRTSRRELLDDVLDAELPRYAEALQRLGE